MPRRPFPSALASLLVATSLWLAAPAQAAEVLGAGITPTYAWEADYGELHFSDTLANGRGVAVADVTGDGRDDLVLGIAAPGNVALVILPQLPDGTLGPEQRYVGQTLEFHQNNADVAVGDVDGDDDMDVALVTGAGLNVWLQRPDGALGNRTVVGSPDLLHVRSVDWEGDGDSDLVTVGFGAEIGYDTNLLQRADDGTWSSAPLFDDDVYHSVTPGHLTNDVRADLVVYGDAGGLQTFKQLVGGGLSAPISTHPDAVADTVAIGDVDGDGSADVATIGGQLFLGDGTGALEAPLQLTEVGGDPAIGDLDGDGLVDVAIGGSDFSPSLQLSDHTFTAPCAQPLRGSATVGLGMGIGDLNDDGRLDVVIPQYSQQTYAILRGAAKGPIEFASMSAPSSIQTGSGVNISGRIDTAGACPDTSSAGQALELRRSDGGGPEEVVDSTVSVATGGGVLEGSFALVDIPDRPGTYTYRVRAAGDASHHVSFSDPIVVMVYQAPDVVDASVNDGGIVYGDSVPYSVHLDAVAGTDNLTVHILVQPEGKAEYAYGDTTVDATSGDASGTITGLLRDSKVRFVWDGDGAWTETEDAIAIEVSVALTGQMYYFASHRDGTYYYRAGRDPVFSATVTPRSAGETMRVLVQRLRNGHWRDYLSGTLEIRRGSIVAGIPHQYLTAGERYRVEAIHKGEGGYLHDNETSWFKFQVKR